MSLFRLAGWLDQCFPAIFGVFYTAPELSYIESEEVDSSLCQRVSYPCLGFFQGQSHTAQPLCYYGREFLDNLFAVVGKDEVVGIPDECETSETVSSTFVSCSLVPFVQVFTHGCLDFCFHAVQGDIGQEGGSLSPYKVANFFFRDRYHLDMGRSETRY